MKELNIAMAISDGKTTNIAEAMDMLAEFSPSMTIAEAVDKLINGEPAGLLLFNLL